MGFTTTLTSKNQFTLPSSVRAKLGTKKGMKFDIYPTADGFIGKLKRKSRILDFAGNLKHLDDGRSWRQIREETDRIMAQEYATKLKNENNSH